MAQSLRRLTYILLAISILLFISAVASVVLLSSVGMYLALSLIIAGSFTMLLTSVLRERLNQTKASRDLLLRESPGESEAAVSQEIE